MFIILIYDISIKSDYQVKVLNMCRQYLFHIQDSCFHGYISFKNYNELLKKLNKIISVDDHIIIYKLSSDKYLKVEELGQHKVKKSIIVE
ncbi:MAG: CRISPR-associated endonuclease Cas2 [Mycoplasmatales bacterium]